MEVVELSRLILIKKTEDLRAIDITRNYYQMFIMSWHDLVKFMDVFLFDNTSMVKSWILHAMKFMKSNSL